MDGDQVQPNPHAATSGKYYSADGNRASALDLGDNCIQNFHLGSYIVDIRSKI